MKDEEDPVKLLLTIGVERLREMLQSGIRLCDEALRILKAESEERKKTESINRGKS